jgi:hypothetical protein
MTRNTGYVKGRNRKHNRTLPFFIGKIWMVLSSLRQIVWESGEVSEITFAGREMGA